ncbi:MAG: amino acid permease [Bacteroidota bacterium]
MKNRIGWKSGAALVVANMIGTGAFTSLGFQVTGVQNTWSILLLWAIGGGIAIAGAFSYAELGSYFQRSGGEYQYLSQIYHPLAGYLSGWVSLTVGFSAPVALAAMAMAAYLQDFLPIPAKVIAILAIVSISLIHSVSLRQSSRFQDITTLLKLLLISSFIIGGLLISSEPSALDLSGGWTEELLLPAFAVALVYVTYSYTGWNAAAYIVEEIEEVRRNLPKALIRGTLLVTVFYVLLQLVFLRHASIEQLRGKVEVGQIVAIQLFGQSGGQLVSYAIAFFLISSISAMIWVGPRVSMVMAEDHGLWKFLDQKNAAGIPVRAIWFQTNISIGMVLTGTFEQILLYCGFILQLFSMLSVAGTFLLRRQQKQLPYVNPGYPWLPALFILASLWILSFLIFQHPSETLIGFTNLGLGGLTYLVSRYFFTK